MTTIALAPRAAPSFYSGMILALIALAFALQAFFLVGLAEGRVGFASPPPAVTEMASLPTPCANP
jgi:uncharacterized RDD family membrane protein YckC